MGTFYHVSVENYEIGKEVSAPEETFYYKKKRDEGLDWVDDAFDLGGPEGAPSRKSTLFAFDRLGYCVSFKNLSIDKNNLKYYKVEIENPTKVPFCLTGLLADYNNKNADYLERVISEYWQPQQEWKLYEYLTPKMKIVEIIKKLPISSMAHSYLADDRKKAISYFGIG